MYGNVTSRKTVAMQHLDRVSQVERVGMYKSLDLHSTQEEDGHQHELLPDRNLKLPDHRHRQDKNDKIGKDVEGGASHVIPVGVDAVASRNGPVPEEWYRRAEKDIDQVGRHTEEDDESNPKLDVPLEATSHKDAMVEQQERDLDEKDDGGIKQRISVEGLCRSKNACQ